ncbi:MAG: hypothetical protein LPK08_02470 [Halomonas sp.]|nr:hypothetical protein [Halomonas sp.]
MSEEDRGLLKTEEDWFLSMKAIENFETIGIAVLCAVLGIGAWAFIDLAFRALSGA